MNEYYDHGTDQICDCCGEHIPQVEHESCNAECVNDLWVCWGCQNNTTNEQAMQLMDILIN